jgi:hypothetical protein
MTDPLGVVIGGCIGFVVGLAAGAFVVLWLLRPRPNPNRFAGWSNASTRTRTSHFRSAINASATPGITPMR